MLTDSHIERKWGETCAQQVMARSVELANRLDQAGTADRKLDVLREADREFKSNGLNPGTTADLTVATILAAKLQAETDKRERRRDVTSQ
jgi:triphosphoribosyl-dephospho-CoA synthase